MFKEENWKPLWFKQSKRYGKRRKRRKRRMEERISVNEASEILGLSTQRVYVLLKKGKFKLTKSSVDEFKKIQRKGGRPRKDFDKELELKVNDYVNNVYKGLDNNTKGVMKSAILDFISKGL